MAAVGLQQCAVAFVRKIAGSVIGAAMTAYFGYHMIGGPRGLVALNALNEKILVARQTLTQLEGERRQWENMVARLRPDNLDPDLLDERARAVLNLAHANDLIIFLPSQKD